MPKKKPGDSKPLDPLDVGRRLEKLLSGQITSAIEQLNAPESSLTAFRMTLNAVRCDKTTVNKHFYPESAIRKIMELLNFRQFVIGLGEEAFRPSTMEPVYPGFTFPGTAKINRFGFIEVDTMLTPEYAARLRENSSCMLTGPVGTAVLDEKHTVIEYYLLGIHISERL
ncbi:MAG: hypothetical protein PHQ23_00785 [Candidatus Wallbacteria bacterium]|nr:hypothetical protein [Candidatus Wallbacteria bacterium]